MVRKKVPPPLFFFGGSLSEGNIFVTILFVTQCKCSEFTSFLLRGVKPPAQTSLGLPRSAFHD